MSSLKEKFELSTKDYPFLYKLRIFWGVFVTLALGDFLYRTVLSTELIPSEWQYIVGLALIVYSLMLAISGGNLKLPLLALTSTSLLLALPTVLDVILPNTPIIPRLNNSHTFNPTKMTDLFDIILHLVFPWIALISGILVALASSNEFLKLTMRYYKKGIKTGNETSNRLPNESHDTSDQNLFDAK